MSVPDSKTGEITIIGTGGGYGESIVIHLGNSHWAVIDSCQHPETKESLPLKYLRNLGVDVAHDVKLIICTHWHDDHILGISELLEEAFSAEFCVASANDVKKFMQLMELDYEKANVEVSNSSTLEYAKCTEILKARGQYLTRAYANRNLISIDVGNSLKSEVFSLSPSDYSMHKFDLEISALMKEYISAARKIPAGSPNSKSVAVFLKLGVHGILLGADLEMTADNKEGWRCVVEKNTVIDRKSSLFKIPHHGSENGFCEEVWCELLHKEVISGITPWNKNGKLPEPQMLYKYFSLSKELYMTSYVFSNKPKKRDKRIEKVLDRLNCKITEVKFQEGIVRCRIDLSNSISPWVIEPIMNAQKIDSSFFEG